MGSVNEDGGLTVEVGESENGTRIVRLTGEIDISTADQLRASVDGAFDGSPEGTVVFDVANVGFIDSSGLAALLAIARAGAAVVVRQPTPTVRRVIEATGVTEVIRVEP